QNNIVKNGVGIWLSYSSSNIIHMNNITGNSEGIVAYESSNNTMAKNEVIDNGVAFVIAWSSNNTISGNNITANTHYGVLVDEFSSSNYIFGNIIKANEEGIRLHSHSSHTIISGNIIINNYYGILTISSNNLIFLNNFIDNTIQASSGGWHTETRWDVGYPFGGNYWSDYKGIDKKSGPNQDQPGADGIADAPLPLPFGKDRYPLMNPVTHLNFRQILYESYAKALDSWYWINKGNELLLTFGEDFIKSFTTPLGILKTIAKKLALGKYSSAELIAKEVITIPGTMALWDISSVLSWVYVYVRAPGSGYSGEITDPSEKLREIFGLLKDGKHAEASYAINDLIAYLRITRDKVNDPRVPAMYSVSKVRVQKIFESTIAFLEGELLSFFQDGTSLTLQETGHKLYLHIYDVQGRHVGMNHKSGKVEVEIRGANYIDLGNVIAILLPPDVTEFRYVVDGTHALKQSEGYNVTVSLLKGGAIVSEVVRSGTINQGGEKGYNVQVLSDQAEINIKEMVPQSFQVRNELLSLMAFALFVIALFFLRLKVGKRLSSHDLTQRRVNIAIIAIEVAITVIAPNIIANIPNNLQPFL
ncbi:MAG: right-handed parallel beta-helix repeat-containing protein, partial [Nitrososphaerales archaeon]